MNFNFCDFPSILLFYQQTLEEAVTNYLSRIVLEVQMKLQMLAIGQETVVLALN